MFVQVAVGAKLHQQVDVILLAKHAVKLDDVWMVQETLNLYLPNALGEYRAVEAQSRLRNLFDRAEQASGFVPV